MTYFRASPAASAGPARPSRACPEPPDVAWSVPERLPNLQKKATFFPIKDNLLSEKGTPFFRKKAHLFSEKRLSFFCGGGARLETCRLRVAQKGARRWPLPPGMPSATLVVTASALQRMGMGRERTLCRLAHLSAPLALCAGGRQTTTARRAVRHCPARCRLRRLPHAADGVG